VTKRFYLTVPALRGSSSGSVDVFNPITMQMEKSYPTPNCSPAGLIITPNQHLVTSCGTVLDLQGNVVATPTGGTDQIWYNYGDNFVYYGAPSGAVIDAESNQVVATLPGALGHTIAADPNNNRVFAPVTGAGIKVFAAQ
jgi:hypothetical protein